MLSFSVINQDISISSIVKEDILKVQKWIEKQNHYLDESFYVNSLDINEFIKRFIEYYVCEDEIFLKIVRDGNIIGIIKGRVEKKEEIELFIWFFMVDCDLRNKGIGKRVLNIIADHCTKSIGVNVLAAGVCSSNLKAIKFWEENNFKKVRVTKNFFDNINKDLIVYRRVL